MYQGPDGKLYPNSPDHYGSYIGAPGWSVVPEPQKQSTSNIFGPIDSSPAREPISWNPPNFRRRKDGSIRALTPFEQFLRQVGVPVILLIGVLSPFLFGGGLSWAGNGLDASITHMRHQIQIKLAEGPPPAWYWLTDRPKFDRIIAERKVEDARRAEVEKRRARQGTAWKKAQSKW